MYRIDLAEKKHSSASVFWNVSFDNVQFQSDLERFEFHKLKNNKNHRQLTAEQFLSGSRFDIWSFIHSVWLFRMFGTLIYRQNFVAFNLFLLLLKSGKKRKLCYKIRYEYNFRELWKTCLCCFLWNRPRRPDRKLKLFLSFARTTHQYKFLTISCRFQNSKRIALNLQLQTLILSPLLSQ